MAEAAVFIVAIICTTTVVLVKIGTSHVERIERIKHGYSDSSIDPKMKDALDYRKIQSN